MKVVINKCFGGFGISVEAAKFMREKGHEQASEELARWEQDSNGDQANFSGFGYSQKFEEEYLRDDPILVEAVEFLGDKASGQYAKLKVVEIPDGVEWEIDEYDGCEHIAEKHRTWG